jgi:hypothetical protein
LKVYPFISHLNGKAAVFILLQTSPPLSSPQFHLPERPI